MSNNAVIIGAGNIGRGFLGQIFFEAGWNTCYVDVSANVVDALNERGEYPLDIVRTGGSRRLTVGNVRAVNGNDHDAAARVIADCDLCVTCVGAKAIKFIIPNLVRGIKLRFRETADSPIVGALSHSEENAPSPKAGIARPFNLLICENLMDADKYIHSLLEPELTPDELANVGLVETSVGRMVPIPDPELLKIDPLLVRAEAFATLPCDRDAFVGNIPDVKNIVPVSPFRFVIERKLYIHNMGHAVCAYLGMYKGYTTISEAIADPEIRVIVREAMTESAVALAKRFAMPFDELIEHTNDLIRRFGNTSLGDTCARVGADIPRKLANSDRLTGASLSVIEAGGRPAYIAAGAAAALAKYVKENGGDASEIFAELSGVTGGTYAEFVTALYEKFASGAGLREVIAAADGLLE